MIGKPRRSRRRPPTLDDAATMEIPKPEIPQRVGYHAPPWKPLSRQALTDLDYGMKRAMKMANEAAEAWHERSNWLNAYCDRQGMDLPRRALFRSRDLWLTDAMDTWAFYGKEVRRYASLIATEFRMRQMLGYVESIEDGSDAKQG